MLEDNFWQDKLKSQKIIKEKKLFEDLINSYQNSVGQINDLDDLYQLALEENNSEISK
jgi:peptide chain release factor 2